MKVASICFGNRTYVFDKVMVEMSSKYSEFHPIALTFDRHTQKVVRESELDYIEYNFLDYCKKQGVDQEPDYEYLDKKDEEYSKNGVSLSWLLYSERYIRLYNKFSYKKSLRIMELNFRFCEEMLDREKPDLVITSHMAAMFDYILMCECKARYIDYKIYIADRISGHVAISDKPIDRWNKYEELIKEVDGWSSIDDEKRNEMATFIESYRSGNLNAICLADEKERPAVYNYLFYLFRRVFWGQDDFTTLSSRKKFFNKIAERIRKAVMPLFVKFEKAENSDKENFVFYPLHLEPEATTLYLAPYYFENQQVVAENVAKSLPIGWYLYLKENPRMIGKRDLAFYKNLKRFSNVRFIKGNVPSRDLIKKSKAVVTVTGTAAMEAAMLDKPSFIFGDVFFKECPNVYKIDSWQEFTDKFKKIVKNGVKSPKDKTPFMWAYRKSLDEGLFYPPLTYPSVLKHENIKKLTNVLMDSLG